jgi:hypothetical protein
MRVIPLMRFDNLRRANLPMDTEAFPTQMARRKSVHWLEVEEAGPIKARSG